MLSEQFRVDEGQLVQCAKRDEFGLGSNIQEPCESLDNFLYSLNLRELQKYLGHCHYDIWVGQFEQPLALIEEHIYFWVSWLEKPLHVAMQGA